MQKIVELLTKAGCNPELVQEISESLVQYKDSIREQFEADYTAKVGQAKKICIEETNAYKRELANKLQIFLETKNAAISSHISRQMMQSESAALNKLRNVKSLIEGIEVHDQTDNGFISTKLENAKRELKRIMEERDILAAKANRQTAIAERVLATNRKLQTENTRLKQAVTVTEGKVNSDNKPRRIDLTRSRTAPTTTRATLVENQTRNAPPIKRSNQTSSGPATVDDIASTMDEII